VGADEKRESGLAHLSQAWTHFGRDEWESASREAAAAIPLLRQKREESLPEAFEALGLAEVMLGRPAQAVEHYLEGLAACRACEERNRLRVGLSMAYRDLGRYGEAESLLREVLADAEAAGSTADQALSFNGLSSLAIVQNHRAEAIPLLQEELRRQDATTKPTDRARVLEVLGVLLNDAGECVRALEFLRQAEKLLAGVGNPARLRTVHTNIARTYVTLGQYDAARALFEEVETASRREDDQNELARSLFGEAELLQMRGRSREAQKRLEEALGIERQRGNRSEQANVLVRLARLDLTLGRYDLAFSRFEEAVALSRASGNRHNEMTTLIESANVYQKLSRQDESFARLLRAGELTGNGTDQGRMMEAMFTVTQLWVAHRWDEALLHVDQALALARAGGGRPAEQKTLELRAAFLVALGRLEEGRHDAEAALVLSRQLGDRAGEAQSGFLVGLILFLEQRYDEARASLEQSLRFERATGSSGPQATTLWALGQVYEKQRNATAALATYRQAAEISESAFVEVRADSLLAGLVESATGTYGRWARLLVATGDVEQAFAVVERARARAFLRRMGNPPPDLRKGVDPVLASEEESLREKMQALTHQLGQEQQKDFAVQDRTELARVAREIDSVRRAYGTLLLRLQEASPEYASLIQPSPLTLPEVQKLLDGETTLIEYFLLEDDNLAWVIERDSVHLVHLNMIRGEGVARHINELRRLIAVHDRAAVGDSFALYHALFAPLVPFIHHSNLFVVPHGPLHALPFAALTPDGGRTYLVERYAFSLLPSASLLPFVLAKRSREGRGMLALGDPDGSLPEAAAEARDVATLYGSRALVGREASIAALRSAPRPIDHLHIAAHAAFDPARPLFSRIRLADGDLAVHDIFGLDLRGTRLVVLSGCETGVGEPTEVGQLEGLSRAFLYAGSPSVVATQWAVDDRASRELMAAFYRHLRAGMRTAEALRQAQVEILHTQEWRHPFFWAPFTLTGDPGRAAK
jgi:CHAT domain-containing protein